MIITKLISATILIATMTFAINGIAVKGADLLAGASLAVGQTNIQQFRTALDLYYIDHNRYPDAESGSDMITILERENYIRENNPINKDQFDYQVKDDGQNYSLAPIAG